MASFPPILKTMLQQTAFNVYYRTQQGNNKKKLNQILVQYVEDWEDARHEVMHMLHKNMESYFKPVPTVINGYKK